MFRFPLAFRAHLFWVDRDFKNINTTFVLYWRIFSLNCLFGKYHAFKMRIVDIYNTNSFNICICFINILNKIYEYNWIWSYYFNFRRPFESYSKFYGVSFSTVKINWNRMLASTIPACVIVKFLLLLLISISLTKASLSKIELREKYGQSMNEIQAWKCLSNEHINFFSFTKIFQNLVS